MSEEKLPSRRRAAFSAVLAALLVAVAELLSFAFWQLGLDDTRRGAILYLTAPTEETPLYVPNTFWHHDLNRRSRFYAPALNSKGTIGPDFPVPKPAGELRVLCLGDSTVEGHGGPFDQAFPAVLEGILKPLALASGRYRDVRVINAGISSHNSAFTLAYLAFRLLHYQPDVVVLKTGFNDYVPYTTAGMGLDYTHAFPKPFRLDPPPQPFWRAARFSFTLRVLGFAAFPRDVLAAADFEGVASLPPADPAELLRNRDRTWIYGENVRSLILLCKGRGIRVLVLDLPTSPNPGHYRQSLGPAFRGFAALLEAEARRVAASEAARFVETGPFLNRNFVDHCHPSRSGHRQIAARVLEALQRELKLPAGAPKPATPPAARPTG